MIRGRLLIGAVALAAALFALWSYRYVASPLPPFGYYYDLGVNIQATANIAAFVKSPQDIFDAIGWAGWDNGPQFIFAPMLPYVFTVTIAHIVGGDAFTAIKLTQVVEVVVAFFSMQWLYRTLFDRDGWALEAGFIYALAPVVLPEIRGNVEFGAFICAAPAALSCGLRLVRRFGGAALPLAACVVSLLSACFVVEALLTVAIPAYAVLVVIARRRAPLWRWLAFSVGGFAALALTTAYYTVPTLTSHLFSGPAARIALLQGGEYSLFSQDLWGLLGLVPREQTISPEPLFNASQGVWLAALVGVPLWIGAVGNIVARARRGRLSAESAALAWIAAACILLALGSNLPGLGPLIWNAIAHIPVMQLLRTPDRLLLFGALAVIVLGVNGWSELSVRLRGPGIPALGMVLVAVLATLDLSQHCLSLEPNWSKEPALAGVQARLRQIGPKRLALDIVKGGSLLDFPYYGAAVTYDRAAWDLETRYLEDGVAGLGIARASAVRSVVATPNWGSDAVLTPDFDRAVAASPLAAPVEHFAGGPTVFSVRDPRPVVSAENSFCYAGGPGELDRLLALPRYSRAAFFYNAACNDGVWVDWDPRLALSSSISVSGDALLGSLASPVEDFDYPYTVGLSYLNLPWYRNAIDGDSVVLSSGSATEIAPGESGSTNIAVDRPGRYTVAVRMMCHAAMSGSVTVDTHTLRFACLPARGLQLVQLGDLRLGVGTHRLSIDAIAADAGSPTFELPRPGDALDGIALIRDDAKPTVSTADTMFSVDHFESGGGAAYLQPLGVRDPDEAVKTERYRWHGPAGRYAVTTSTDLAGGAAMDWISLNGAAVPCCAVAGTPGRGAATEEQSVSGVELSDRDIITAHFEADPFDPRAIPHVQLGLSMLAGKLVAAGYSSGLAFYDAPIDKRGLPVTTGTHARYTLNARAPIETLGVTVNEDVPSGGMMTARCGLSYATSDIEASGNVAVVSPNARSCSIDFAWSGPGVVSSISAFARPAVVPPLHGLRYLARGRYAVEILGATGSAVPGRVEVDGLPVRHELNVRVSGVHRIDLIGADPRARIIAFLAHRRPRVPVVAESTRLAALRWRISVPSTATIEAAVLPDGNWRLRAADGHVYDGRRCNIITTCFLNVAAGTYTLSHAWPAAVLFGVLVTLSTVTFSALVAWISMSAKVARDAG